jgi:hypothetical protein
MQKLIEIKMCICAQHASSASVMFVLLTEFTDKTISQNVRLLGLYVLLIIGQ